MSRAEVMSRLEAIRDANELADLAFYAYRDLSRTDPAPFVKAALERNPVSIAACRDLPDDALPAAVHALADMSIYDEPARVAQPDEVWNYARGDGAEKALLLANLIHERHPRDEISIEVTPDAATVRSAGRESRFPSGKGLQVQTWDCGTTG